MIHHYMTEYSNEKGEVIFESWIQINLFGFQRCYSIKSFVLEPGKDDLTTVNRVVDGAAYRER